MENRGNRVLMLVHPCTGQVLAGLEISEGSYWVGGRGAK